MPEISILGRYLPGASPLHRMDPRTKLLMAFSFMFIIIFAARTFAGLAVCALLTIGLFVLAQIPLSKALQSIAPLMFLLVITALLNIFFVQTGATLWEWNFVRITEGGLHQATFIVFRVLLLLLSMSLLTLVTATLDITDAFEYLLAPLTRIGLPAHELSMIMGIALRFLPQFLTEFQTIYRAQISRGATFTASTWRDGLRMLGSLMVPLFTSAFRHAETLSQAMDARCYHGGPGRSRLRPLNYGPLDRNALIILLVIFALVVASNFLVF